MSDIDVSSINYDEILCVRVLDETTLLTDWRAHHYNTSILKYSKGSWLLVIMRACEKEILRRAREGTLTTPVPEELAGLLLLEASKNGGE